MKNLALVVVVLLSACTSMSIESLEEDRARHNEFLEDAYNMEHYDPEYADDCYFYQQLVCEFEE